MTVFVRILVVKALPGGSVPWLGEPGRVQSSKVVERGLNKTGVWNLSGN